MPDFDITSPSGQKFRVTAPEGATQEQILAYAQANMPKEPATNLQKVQSSIPMRIISGMRAPIDAGAQLLSHAVPSSVNDVVDYIPSKFRASSIPAVNYLANRYLADPRPEAIDTALRATKDEYQQARQAAGQTGLDIANFAGNVLSPANAAIASRVPGLVGASLPKLAGVGAGIGGVGGLLTPVTDEGDFATQKAVQGGVGLATGAVLTPAISKVIEAVGPRISAWFSRNFKPEELGANASLRTDEAIKSAFREIGADMDSVPKAYLNDLRQQVTTSLKEGKIPDAAAMVRKSDFENLGMQPILGQITRDPTQFARERNLRAVPNLGEPLMQRLDSQNQRLQEIVRGYGGPQAMEPQQGGAKLVSALKGIDTSMANKASAAWKAGEKSSGREATVPLQGLAQDYAKVVDDFADKIPTAIQNKFAALGVDPSRPSNQKQIFSVEKADDLIKAINDHVGGDRATNTALSRLRDAVKNAMTQSGAEDVFAAGRKLSAERFKLQDALPALSEVAEGRASPDKFVNTHIINAETSKVKLLADTLKGNPEAFNEAKNQLGSYIQRAAFGENVAGDKVLSPERLAKALRQLGTEKLKVFYTPEEIATLQRVSRVGAYINQIPSAAPVLGNPNMAWAGQLLGRIPGAPTAIQIGNTVGRAVKSASDVNTSLSAKVPAEAAKLDPATIRTLSRLFALGGLGAAETQ